MLPHILVTVLHKTRIKNAEKNVAFLRCSNSTSYIQVILKMTNDAAVSLDIVISLGFVVHQLADYLAAGFLLCTAATLGEFYREYQTNMRIMLYACDRFFSFISFFPVRGMDTGVARCRYRAI